MIVGEPGTTILFDSSNGELVDVLPPSEADGYQPPSYEPVNPERRTAQTPSDGLI